MRVNQGQRTDTDGSLKPSKGAQTSARQEAGRQAGTDVESRRLLTDVTLVRFSFTRLRDCETARLRWKMRVASSTTVGYIKSASPDCTQLTLAMQ